MAVTDTRFQAIRGTRTQLNAGIADTTNGANLLPGELAYITDELRAIVGTDGLGGEIKLANTTGASVAGNFAALDVNGNISDSSFTSTSFEVADITILKEADVTNTLISTSIINPLSANQGKILQDTKANKVTPFISNTVTLLSATTNTLVGATTVNTTGTPYIFTLGNADAGDTGYIDFSGNTSRSRGIKYTVRVRNEALLTTEWKVMLVQAPILNSNNINIGVSRTVFLGEIYEAGIATGITLGTYDDTITSTTVLEFEVLADGKVTITVRDTYHGTILTQHTTATSLVADQATPYLLQFFARGGGDFVDVYPLETPQEHLSSLVDNGDIANNNITIDDSITSVTNLWSSQKINSIVPLTGATTEIASNTGSYTYLTTDGMVNVTMSLIDNFTVVLPTSASAITANRVVKIRRAGTGSGVLTIDGNGTETINGTITVTIDFEFDTLILRPVIGGWYIE